MGRKIGPDPNKLMKIREILRKNPQGLWIRKIARESKISKSTVHRYINEFMLDEIEDVLNGGYGFVKIIKLKK